MNKLLSIITLNSILSTKDTRYRDEVFQNVDMKI